MKYFVNSFLFLCFVSVINLGAQKIDDSLEYYSKIINDPTKRSELVSAYVFFRNYKEEALQRNDRSKSIYGYVNIAVIEKELGEIYNSEKSAIEALKLLNGLKTNDWTEKSRITIYNHLGLVFIEQLNFNKALEYYDLALRKLDKPINKARIYGNIGNVFFQMRNYNSAIKEYKKALKICSDINAPKLKARLLDNLGEAQSKLNHPDAINNMLKALRLRLDNGYQKGVITSYLSLAEYYIKRNAKDSARIYSEKAIKIADSSKIIKQRLASLAIALRLNDEKRVKEYLSIKDSLEYIELNNKNRYADAKYNIEKKEKDIEVGKRREERLLIALAFITMAALFLYFLIKSKHKKDKLQQVYNTETHISKKVHDEVANDVYQVMTQLQSNPKISESIIDDLDQIYSKTRDISKEHSILDFKEPFYDILNDLLLSYNTETINVIAKDIAKIDWNALSEIKKTTIYKVLQEFMINMKKHSQASVAVLTFKQYKRKTTITYSDNGVGAIIKKNTGLQNVENRIKSINGTVTFESEINKGFKAKMTV